MMSIADHTAWQYDRLKCAGKHVHNSHEQSQIQSTCAITVTESTAVARPIYACFYCLFCLYLLCTYCIQFS